MWVLAISWKLDYDYDDDDEEDDGYGGYYFRHRVQSVKKNCIL